MERKTVGRNENFVKKYITSLSPTDGVAMDVGANKGIYTTLLADKFSLVYAIEPHPKNIEDLARAVSGKSNVTIRQGVIGTHDGKHTLFTTSNPGGHSIESELADSKRWGHNHDSTLDVDGWTLDSFSNDNVKFIKCDIEGGESEIFFHGTNFFKQNKPTIILETHRVEFDWKILVDFFKGFGYTVYDDAGNVVDDMKYDNHYLIEIN